MNEEIIEKSEESRNEELRKKEIINSISNVKIDEKMAQTIRCMQHDEESGFQHIAADTIFEAIDYIVNFDTYPADKRMECIRGLMDILHHLKKFDVSDSSFLIKDLFKE